MEEEARALDDKYVEGITAEELELVNLTYDLALKADSIAKQKTTLATFNYTKILNALRDIQLEIWSMVGLRLVTMQMVEPGMVDEFKKYVENLPSEPVVGAAPSSFGQYL